jgi:hypothetical protein
MKQLINAHAFFPDFQQQVAGCPALLLRQFRCRPPCMFASTDDNRDCKSICYFLIIQLGWEKITATKSIQKIISCGDEE